MMPMRFFEYGEVEITHLKSCCKKLGAVIDEIGKIERAVNPCLFSALIDSIVGQQISAKAAATVSKRLYDLCRGDYKNLCNITTGQIQACGMSMRKAGYIKGVAEAEINFDDLAQKPDDEIISTLIALPGVGIWTAEMLLIFSLQRPNIISFGDLAIRRGICKLYNLKSLNKEQFARYAKRYTPYASIASLYLWEISH